MASRIEHRAEFDHPFDKVLAAFADEDAIRHRLSKIGGVGAELLSHEKSASTITFTVNQAIPADKLPSLVRNVHSGDLKVHREQTWTLAARSATGSATASVDGVPGSITANSVLNTAGAGAKLAVTGAVKVAVPLVGGKIERAIAENVERLLTRESEFVASVLAEGS